MTKKPAIGAKAGRETTSRLLTLPPEVRTNILSFLLPGSTVEEAEKHERYFPTSNKRRVLGDISRKQHTQVCRVLDTCSLLRAEFLQVLALKVTWPVKITSESPKFGHVRIPFLPGEGPKVNRSARLGRQLLHHVRHLDISIYCDVGLTVWKNQQVPSQLIHPRLSNPLTEFASLSCKSTCFVSWRDPEPSRDKDHNLYNIRDLLKPMLSTMLKVKVLQDVEVVIVLSGQILDRTAFTVPQSSQSDAQRVEEWLGTVDKVVGEFTQLRNVLHPNIRASPELYALDNIPGPKKHYEQLLKTIQDDPAIKPYFDKWIQTVSSNEPAPSAQNPSHKRFYNAAAEYTSHMRQKYIALGPNELKSQARAIRESGDHSRASALLARQYMLLDAEKKRVALAEECLGKMAAAVKDFDGNKESKLNSKERDEEFLGDQEMIYEEMDLEAMDSVAWASDAMVLECIDDSEGSWDF